MEGSGEIEEFFGLCVVRIQYIVSIVISVNWFFFLNTCSIGNIKLCMCCLLFQPSMPSCLYVHTSANTCGKCALYLLDFETSSGRLWARTGCRWGEVHHCGTGRCEWDRMCGAVRASPLLTSLLVCQVACGLEWCIAAKTQRGNQEWKQRAPREGSQVDKSLLSLICRLSGGFLKKSCSAAQKIQNCRHFFFLFLIITFSFYSWGAQQAHLSKSARGNRKCYF